MNFPSLIQTLRSYNWCIVAMNEYRINDTWICYIVVKEVGRSKAITCEGVYTELFGELVKKVIRVMEGLD